MAYQVIARKYRPQRFSDVVGQEHVTQTLENAIRQNRIAHAYIFCGPRGTGKTTIARIFAMCLNCTGGPKVDLDESDSRVQEIREGRSIDVFEIDGASNRGIEEIRELRETVKFAPASSRFKIYIIDEVHMLTKEAFNALLKTLEEPPAHVKFMFATTEPEKVLPTILSRCQRFDLRRIPVDLIVKHLGEIAGKEKVKIEPAALYAIARGAEGCMRDAESALDQLISFCGEKIVEEDVLSMFGLTGRAQIVSLSSAILNGETQKVIKELDDLSRHGKDLGRLLSDLLNRFRDLLVFQVSKGDWSLLEVPEAEKKTIAEQAGAITQDALTRIMEVLTDAETRFRDAASKKIFLEVALLKAMQARQSVSIDTVVQQLGQLRAGSAAATQSAPKKAVPAAGTSRSPSATISPPEPDLANVWTALLEAVSGASQFTRSCLQDAHPVSLAKQVLTIAFDAVSDHFDLVNNSRTQVLLQTKLQELGHGQLQVKFIRQEGQAPSTAPVAAAPPLEKISGGGTPPSRADEPAVPQKEAVNVEEVRNDPLIKKALEMFKGHIVEVRA